MADTPIPRDVKNVITRSSDIYEGEELKLSHATLPFHVVLEITETDDRVSKIIVTQFDLIEAVRKLTSD